MRTHRLASEPGWVEREGR